MSTAGPADDGKRDLRRRLSAARRARDDERRRDDAARLAAGLPALLDGVDDPVCLFVPVGSEPGAAPDGALPVLDASLALGRTVLLPVTVGEQPLDWAVFTGRDSLGPGPYGLLEPLAARRGPGAIAAAGLVVVPALAVDRRGTRLGRGGGHYDRSLALLGPQTWRVALVGDDELLDEPLPALAHDQPVHAVWRPRHGVTGLGTGTP